jgi:gliding motility-associated-like protein
VYFVKEILKNEHLRSLKHIITFCFAVFIANTPLFSAHIIGGEMTYNCLGNNNYRITIKLYRDAAGGGAEFDGAPGSIGPATITVYRGSTIFLNTNAGTPQEDDVPPDVSNPCLIIPPNVEVEEGVYVFDVNLPQSNETYTISYQRCCRNNTITNLLNPGDTGATYTVDITPQSQSSCNSSPSFNNQPPIIICAGTDINFDFSATDPDGDFLVYELCAPFTGGGNDVDNPSTPGGVAPDPDLPPPYSTVDFAPGFSALSPMQGDPEVTINSSTGLITGTPVLLGQYAVGVCVFEYRNGVLLSTVRRDFQFNVAECEPTVVAEIESDEILDNQEFRIISCGENTVSFVNESFQEAFIDDFYWEFEINGATERIEEWSPTVEFPADGVYDGLLVLNEGTACSDTAVILVEIYPDIVTDFEYEYDTCVYGPVDFTNLSFSNAGPDAIVDYMWDFGDGTVDSVANPSHLFAIPGNLPVSLTITDINDCVETYTEVIDYFPVPTLIVISPSTFNGCAPAEIFFDNLSVPIDSTYDITWDFGDGNFGTDVSPTHIYDTPGTYTIAIEITSPIGCFTDTIFPNLITVRPSPMAGFSFTPEQPNNFEPTVSFTDESTEAAQWRWDIDDGLYRSIEQNPVYTFQDTGIHVVQQVVIHESGCTDTLTQIIDVEPQVRYFLPNAFTPNFDGINDEFRGNGVMAGATGFSFQIWNRYGELVFETADPFEAWNGQKNNTGRFAPNGVYVVVVSYTNPRGKAIELKGFATLVR